MRLFASVSFQGVPMALAAAAFLLIATPCISAQDDPPAQAGRLSYISGNVSIQQIGSDDWGQALPNLPFGPGDRVVTGGNGRVEIQVGQTFFRVGPNSDMSFVEDSPRSISVGLAQGSIHLHSLGLWPGQRIHVNTPSGSGGVDSPGEELRVDVLPDEDAVIFTNIGLQAFASGPGIGGVTIAKGQALELIGSNPVDSQWLQPASPDSLDYWSQSRDQQIRSASSYQYVSPEISGAYELDAAGDWQPDTPYGPVWFPRNVPYGWAPYHYGHWINHAPWGWVWVEDESWGYAPFHYGRWVSLEGRWGWVPGPPTAHPVWSPALVVFAGGIHVGGAGVSAWFPLGPGEVYHPWYHASPRYIDEVNISNIRESPRVHVQTTYVNINVVNVTYVNRTIGVSAMRQEDFAAGRPAHQASVVVDVNLFDHVQVLERPEVQPPAHPFASHPSLQPVHVSAVRPSVINENGKLLSAKPGVPPVDPPVKPTPPARPLPGRIVVAPPSGAKSTMAAPVAPLKPNGTPASAPVNLPTSAGKPLVKTTAEPPVQPVAPAPSKSTPPVKPEAKQTPATTPSASNVSKPAGEPGAGTKPPIAPTPAKPATAPPPKAVPPAAAKPPQDKKPAPENKGDKGKKEEKKSEK